MKAMSTFRIQVIILNYVHSQAGTGRTMDGVEVGTTISGSGSAGNCYFGGPGYCKVAADVNALTISYTPTNWAVAGDFNSWSVSATPMTFEYGDQSVDSNQCES